MWTGEYDTEFTLLSIYVRLSPKPLWLCIKHNDRISRIFRMLIHCHSCWASSNNTVGHMVLYRHWCVSVTSAWNVYSTEPFEARTNHQYFTIYHSHNRILVDIQNWMRLNWMTIEMSVVCTMTNEHSMNFLCLFSQCFDWILSFDLI